MLSSLAGKHFQDAQESKALTGALTGLPPHALHMEQWQLAPPGRPCSAGGAWEATGGMQNGSRNEISQQADTLHPQNQNPKLEKYELQERKVTSQRKRTL